jgi:lambda family phage tail tape measure protein
MATAATIDVLLRANTAQYRAAMIDAGRVAQQNLGAIQKESAKTAQSISAMNKAAAGFLGFQALSSGIGALIEAQKSIQAIQYGLQSATGSAASAEKAYSFVAQTAKELGLNLQGAAKDFTRLSASASAANIPMADQQKLFTQLARSATALHLNQSEVSRATNALAQSFSKGKFQAEELRQQLSEAIPGAFARFQKAVLESTKGTDLAGKSFDDLLQGGLLDVQRFLPAMVKALEETGRGAESASKGLTAELNRLSNAWFDLKVEASGGLFSDVAATSVRLMTNNLNDLAGAATLAGGVLAARVLGAGVAAGAGAFKTAVIAPGQQRFGDAVSAAMTVDLAKARAAEASEAVKQAKAAQALNAEWKTQTGLAANLARDQMAVAFASNEAAQKTLLHQQNTAALSSNIRARKDAEVNSEKASRALAKAQVNYNAAVDSGNVAKAREMQLRGRVLALQEAEIIASNQLAAAKAREAAASQAASLGESLKRGASAVGAGALALVGGPVGATILAIGGLALAYASMQRKAEEARKEFEAQVESLDLLSVSLEDVANQYDRVGSGVGVREIATAWNEAGVSIRKADEEMKRLQERIEFLQRVGKGSWLGVSADQETLEEARAKLEALGAEIEPVRAQFLRLESDLRKAIRPELFEQMRAASLRADNVTFENLRAQLNSAERAAFGAAEAINKITTAAGGAVWQQQIELIRKTSGEYKAWLTEQGKAIKAAGGVAAMTEEQRKAFNGQAAAMKYFIGLNDQADKSRKASTASTRQAVAAAKQQENQYQTTVDKINRQIALDRESMLLNDKMTAAERLRVVVTNELESAKNKLSEAEQARVKVLLDEAVAQGKAKAEMDEARKAAESMIELQNQLNAAYASRQMSNDADLAGMTRGSDQVEQMRRLVDLQQEYQRQVESLNERYSNREQSAAQAAAYQNELDRVRSHHDAMLAQEEGYQQQRNEIMANGWNGALVAMEDYVANANNVAGQMQTFFTNAFSGLENVISDFISKGKADWKGFVDSLAAEFVRMAVKQQLSKLLQKFLPGVSENASNAGAMQSAASALAASATPLYGAAAALQAAAASLAAAGVANGGTAPAGGSGGGGWANLFTSILSMWGGGGGGATASSASSTPAFLSWMQGGYAEGGFTGRGGKYQPAGMVHKGEGVLSQPEINALGGESGFNALRRAIRSGYANGGMVGGSGRVRLGRGPEDSAGPGAGRGRAITVEQHFHNPRMSDRRSDSQRAADSAMKLSDATRFA